MDTKKTVWILNRIKGFGVQTFKRLEEKLGDVSKLLSPAVQEEVAAHFNLGAEFCRHFQEFLEGREFERELDRCSQAGIHLLALSEPDYPGNLAQIYDPPLILYVTGELLPEDGAAVAIVGTRSPSTYGLRAAGRFASELGACGITVVSGLAKGIDAEAHRGALRGGGRTIAVLGCGIDIVYPKEHKKLYEEIAGRGAVVSEFPLGIQPESFYFPLRNRVIAGLSLGTLVVEAAHKSGSLITASLALDEGRQVYAVPGPVDAAGSLGTNELIQEGAKLVLRAEDILEDLAPQIRGVVSGINQCCHSEAQPKNLSTEILQPCGLQDDSVTNPLLKLLAGEPLYCDEIAAQLNRDPVWVNQQLTSLELGGAVKRVLGGRFIRV